MGRGEEERTCSITRVWRSSQILSLVNIVAGRRWGPYSDSMPGHLISSLVTKHFARLLGTKGVSEDECRQKRSTH